jgi:hypothetical protein
MTPRRHRPLSRLAASLLVASLASLAACSDDGEAIDPDADEEVIEDSVLTIDDLPEGFEEVDADDGDDSDDGIEDCADDAGIDADELDENRVVEAEPVAFERSSEEEFVSLTASIGSVRDAGLAARTLELFDDDDFQDCLFESLEDAIGDSSSEIGAFEPDVIDAAADGDASAAVAVEMEIDGFDAELQQHLVLVGRFGVSLQAVAVGVPVDDDLVEDAIDEMIDRIEDATDE